MEDITVKEVVRIMEDGGAALCEQAEIKWRDKTYYPDFDWDTRKKHINRWKAIREKMRDIRRIVDDHEAAAKGGEMDGNT